MYDELIAEILADHIAELQEQQMAAVRFRESVRVHSSLSRSYLDAIDLDIQAFDKYFGEP